MAAVGRSQELCWHTSLKSLSLQTYAVTKAFAENCWSRGGHRRLGPLGACLRPLGFAPAIPPSKMAPLSSYTSWIGYSTSAGDQRLFGSKTESITESKTPTTMPETTRLYPTIGLVST